VKRFLKQLANVISVILVIPWLIVYRIYLLILGQDRAVQWLSQRASRWPGVFGEYLRRSALRYVLEDVADDVVISFGTIFSHRQVRIERGVYIGAYCVIGKAHIGADTLIADSVMIPSGKHQHNFERADIPIKQQSGRLETIYIGQDCWIGSNATILANIASHCIVSAGSLVREPTNEYEIIAGNPAKVVGKRKN